MSDWGIALIAAGSAVAGSVATGWFTRNAGHRQAAAAQHAGDRQADALIATAQATLEGQRAARTHDRRRQVYAQFIEVAQRIHDFGSRDREDLAALARAAINVELEGPEEVCKAAGVYFLVLAEAVTSPTAVDETRLQDSQMRFLESAKGALWDVA
ncbi:hypothetical protein ACLB9X_31315 [Streptomyces sp. 5K101]|uniref:hypothetical protein n=1 Tax=Streptomyces sp. 5K101 TaxID=3390037 RepID=UPI0039764DB1